VLQTSARPLLPGALVPLSLDLEQAWSHLKSEFDDNPSHVSLPFLNRWIDQYSGPWLADLKSRLRRGEYVVQSVIPRHDQRAVGRSPKASCLDLEDDVLYTSIVVAILPDLIQAGFNSSCVCGPFITAVPKGQWTQGHRYWFRFLESRSEVFLEDGYRYIAQSDVRDFFPSIQHHRLLARLRKLDCSPQHLDLLGELLALWFPSGRGLPWDQASHILSSAFLGTVDQRIQELGLPHLRLADDFRVFCHSAAEGETVLSVLDDSLRELGLECNQRKTKVVPVGALAYKSPITAYLNKIGAQVVTQALRATERAGLVGINQLTRKPLYKLLRQVHRPYLGRLVASLPDSTSTILALLKNEVPPSYLPLIAPNLHSDQVDPQVVTALKKAMINSGGLRSVGIVLCRQLGLRPPLISNGNSSIERLEKLYLYQGSPDLLMSAEWRDHGLEKILLEGHTP
jgi:Reverse transcriptase (RNA-dependent DNA polymerase)